MIDIVRICPFCGEPSSVSVQEKEYERYSNGAFAQDAFISLTPEEREIVISGSHPKCFDDAFAEDDDDDPEV